MSFFDYDPMSCPRDGQYYFNILVTNIGINPLMENGPLDQGIVDFWDIQNINEPRPSITHVYIDDTLEEDIDLDITRVPHCVVEVSASFGISWEHMIDFDTDDPWRIDLDGAEN